MKENYDSTGIARLCNAIIYQAVKDYKHYANALHKNPNSEMAINEIDSLERFFRSDYFELLSELSGIELDGETILFHLRRN